MPVVSEPQMRGRPHAVESLVLSLVASRGQVSHSELVRAIMETMCCSAAEAEALIRDMTRRGLLSQTRVGGVVYWHM